MVWWAWIVLGLVLIGGEIATPGGFFLLFFGAGAIAVGFLVLGGIVDTVWVQWLLFTVTSLASLALIRPRIVGRLQRVTPERDVDALTGETAVIAAAIPPGGVGRAELRGSTWDVRNAGADALAPGDRVRVERLEGLLLHVRREA